MSSTESDLKEQRKQLRVTKDRFAYENYAKKPFTARTRLIIGILGTMFHSFFLLTGDRSWWTLYIVGLVLSASMIIESINQLNAVIRHLERQKK